MNKKILNTVLFAAAAFVSTFASADITYTNSADFAGDGQNENAVAVAGGGGVRANDLIIVGGADDDIVGDDTIIVRLPAGINFVGEPTYLVERAGGATATVGLTLKDTSEFGDPTLDDPEIALADTNGDGGMDRALVTASSDSTAGDTLTISLNVTAGSDVTAAAGLKASVIVGGNLAVVQEIVDVVAALSTPVSSAAKGQGETPQTGGEDVDTSGAPFFVTIPADTAGGTSLTLTPGSDLAWATSGSTITWTVHTPGFSVDALTPVSSTTVVGPPSATTAVTLKTNWASTVTNDDPIQIEFTVGMMNVDDTDIGFKNIVVDGAVEGNAQVVEVLPNGSEATISDAGPDAPEIVKGSSAPQSLPTIDVTENFDGDLGASFTITAGTGLTFVSIGDFAVGGIDGGTGTVTVNTASTVITVTMPQPIFNGASDTVSISGITATAEDDASGNLTVTVDSNNVSAEFGPKDDILTVATAVDRGGVDISIKATEVNDVGQDGYVGTSTITLTEETYGAITTTNASQVNEAFFRVTPSSNATILAIGVTTDDYPAGGSPTIAVAEDCEAENGVMTGAWICLVEADSTSIVEGTSTVSVEVTYETDEATVGDTVDMTFDGNSDVEGSVIVANVDIATTAEVTSQIPDLTPGDDTAAELAEITITENFDGAVTADGSFRLVAPQGVAFQDAASVQAQASIGTATITATFNPNDTLILTAATTATITFTAKAVIAGGLSGLQTFDLFDGDIEGEGGAGITAEEVTIAYAGELDDLKAGDDGSVNLGFQVTNTAAGGFGEYEATSSDDDVATVTVNGSSIVVTGVSEGNVTIEVEDELMATATFDIAVTTGAAQPDSTNDTKPSTSAATFTAGASTDGGDTFASEFTTDDVVTIVATVNVDPVDQGSDGEVHVAIKSDTDDGVTFGFMNEAGDIEAWNLTIAGLGAAVVAEPLGATYHLTIFSGSLAAGTHRIALAYSTEDEEFAYTGKAIVITVTEAE